MTMVTPYCPTHYMLHLLQIQEGVYLYFYVQSFLVNQNVLDTEIFFEITFGRITLIGVR